MSIKKGNKPNNVRRQYHQLFLSGYEHLTQPQNQNSDSKALPRLTESAPRIRKGERSYNVSVSLVIESVGDDSGEYVYRILLNDDPDVSIAPYSVRSKKKTGQDVNLPKKGIKGGDSFSMVYGIHKNGKRSLSHTNQHPIQRVIPQIYSFILGAIDRAVECTILIPENEKGNDDARERIESTFPQKSLGADKKKGRGKKIRNEILPETLPEETALVVDDDGTVLGVRQGNREVGPINLGGRADNGKSIADALADGESPDIGF